MSELNEKHVICPNCTHDFQAVSQHSQDEISKLKEQLAKANEKVDFLRGELEEWQTPKNDWQMSQYWKREYLKVCEQLKQQQSDIRREAILEAVDAYNDIECIDEHDEYMSNWLEEYATKIGG